MAWLPRCWMRPPLPHDVFSKPPQLTDQPAHRTHMIYFVFQNRASTNSPLSDSQPKETRYEGMNFQWVYGVYHWQLHCSASLCSPSADSPYERSRLVIAIAIIICVALHCTMYSPSSDSIVREGASKAIGEMAIIAIAVCPTHIQEKQFCWSLELIH